MKTRTAYLLRRTTRKLIAWSNRLDAPSVTVGKRLYEASTAVELATARIAAAEEWLARARRR